MLVFGATACGRFGFESQRSSVADAPSDVAVDVACGTNELQTLECQPGYAGAITQMRTYQCTGPVGTWSSWSTISDSCAASAYTWQPISAATGPFAAALSAQAGAACLPMGATMPCSMSAGSMGYYHYDTCRCQ